MGEWAAGAMHRRGKLSQLRRGGRLAVYFSHDKAALVLPGPEQKMLMGTVCPRLRALQSQRATEKLQPEL